MTQALASPHPRQPPPDLECYRPLLQRLAGGSPGATEGAEWSELVDAAVTLWSRPGFDTLVSLPRVRFTPYEHQVRAAQAVLRRMRGRAILADEVGLGKTIEAGLVLAELRLRGLADRALVVCPAGLVHQWREELDHKFALPSVVPSGGALEGLADRPVVIASLSAARRDPLGSALRAEPWDVVIIDEAHRVRSPRTASGRLARALRARYLLLLTATPVENRLDELFALVSLVAPGLLGTAQEFRARHGGGADPVAARDVPTLQARMREVMVRHRRSEVALLLPQRLAETRRVRAGREEASLYAELSGRLRREASGAAASRLMALRSVARLAGSCPASLAPSLSKLGWSELAAAATDIPVTAKDRLLVDLLTRRAAQQDKVVVFTAFRRTAAHLAGLLEAAGLPALVYHGGLSRADKERVIAGFRDDAGVLVTTEAAGEGRNLQFCHVMINYDLPWNPMLIEQRLGRLHRIGQQRDVELTNLVTAETIDDHVLRVLEMKINLFELVVGELDMILGRVEDELDFEGRVFSSYVDAADDAEFAVRLDSLGERLAQARGGYLASRETTDALVGGIGQ